MGMLAKDRNLEIVEAIQNGHNSKVLNDLYQTALPQIVKYICINNGDEEEAKDIFQDAVVALFTTVKLGKFEEGKDVNGFLFFVSRNLWINRIKKRNKQMDLSYLPIPLTEENPLAVVITDEKRNVIAQVLGKTGAKCKQILTHVIYDNYTMKEIAKIMDFSGEDVAKSTHYRCKQKLMELVENNQAIQTLFRE